MDSTIYFEVFVLIDVLVGDVFCNHIVRHVTGTATVMIDTSCWTQMSQIRSRTRVATSPCKAGLRYFVIHTRCKWISNTVCAPRRYSAIPEVYPARTC